MHLNHRCVLPQQCREAVIKFIHEMFMLKWSVLCCPFRRQYLEKTHRGATYQVLVETISVRAIVKDVSHNGEDRASLSSDAFTSILDTIWEHSLFCGLGNTLLLHQANQLCFLFWGMFQGPQTLLNFVFQGAVWNSID